MKNRTRETCTSGTVRDEGGNILIYSANDREDRGNVGIIRSPVRASILPDQSCHRRRQSPHLYQNEAKFIYQALNIDCGLSLFNRSSTRLPQILMSTLAVERGGGHTRPAGRVAVGVLPTRFHRDQDFGRKTHR